MEQENTVDYKKLYKETLSELCELKALNGQLLHRLNLLLRSAYGNKSERFADSQQNPGQTRLDFEQEVLVEQASTAKTQKTAPGTKKPQKKSPDIS